MVGIMLGLSRGVAAEGFISGQHLTGNIRTLDFRLDNQEKHRKDCMVDNVARSLWRVKAASRYAFWAMNSSGQWAKP